MNIYELFISILHMGATASIIILAVLFVRVLMRRFPKKYAYLLWIIVGIRLVCPVALSSPVSLFNLKPLTDSRSVQWTEVPVPGQQTNTKTAKTEHPAADVTKNTDPTKNADPVRQDTNHRASAVQDQTASKRTTSDTSITDSNPVKTAPADDKSLPHPVMQALSLLWLAGVMAFLLWNIALTFRMRRRLNRAVLYRDNIYECDNIPSPFVMGLLRPRIYIPFRLGSTEREYILAHEQYHIRRKDYLIKAVAFLLVILYWFHPLVWIAYICMVRDMEMSCDEYVLTASDTDLRRNYSQSLLSFATNQRHLSVGLLSFGETNTRRRVKHILQFRKKGKWVSIVALVLVAGAALVCLTNGVSSSKRTTTDHDTRKIIGTCTIHNYETRLLMDRGNLIKDSASSYNQLYEGRFVLATYRDGKKYDEIEIKAKNTEPVMHFPASISLHARDYDGDRAADDFAIGQPLDNSAMTYQFFTVEENGSILPFTVSEDPINYVIATKDQYSPSFEVSNDVILYTMYDPETGKTEKRDMNLSKIIDVKKSEETESSLVRKMQTAITAVMPQKVIDEIKNKRWKNTAGTYSVANTEDFDATLRLDFTFEQNVLTDYTSKEYGFVDRMPEERITKSQAFTLVRKFARNFLDRNLETSELYTPEKIPPRYDSEDYLVIKDTKGGTYAVQLNHNMVVLFTQAQMVYSGEGEQEDTDKVRIGYWSPSSSETGVQYTTPGGATQKKLQQLCSGLDAGANMSKSTEKRWKKDREAGCQIQYRGNTWDVYQNGCIHFLYGADAEQVSYITVLYMPELTREILRYCRESLQYEPIPPSRIKQLTSATLSYRDTEKHSMTEQTITDKNTLSTLETILSEATYLRGGSACPFGDAVLTLRLKDGGELKLTWACDDCRIFRINGVYYKYIDEFLSTSPDGIRAFFDKIPMGK